MDFEKLAAEPNPPHEINIVVELPLRSDPIKYQFDRTAGVIVVDRCRYTTRFYPVPRASSRRWPGPSRSAPRSRRRSPRWRV
jgi:hypothetical protein